VIAVGDMAPGFELADQDGRVVKLSDFSGQNVVLYFYPKADTPGCTIQACGIRDREADYASAGAAVLGVSPDTPAELRRFADKYGLGFTLLADTEHEAAEAYGVWVEKKTHGDWGNQRATFVIDPDGVVRHVLPEVSPKTHDDEVLAALSELAGP
jgi:thioredoxin-dependent peroxiredoxin